MNHDAINKLVGELLSLHEEDCGSPFPYDGGRKLIHEDSELYENLIAHLDLYFYDIASHCSGVKKILKWPKERLLESQEKLSKSFLEKYPQYRPLKPVITESNTPDLYKALALHEKMRIQLLDLLSQLLQAQPSLIAT